MLRFAFKPRHPVTKVAFTADGRELVTAQPFTSLAVRDRLTGTPRWAFPLTSRPQLDRLEVHPTTGEIAVCSRDWRKHFDPVTGNELLAGPDAGAKVTSVHGTLGPTNRWWVTPATETWVTLVLIGRRRPQVIFQARAVELDSSVRTGSLDRLRVIAYSPDGTRLAVGGGETIQVFDLRPLEGLPPSRTTPVFDPLFTLERPDPTQHGTFADKQAEYWAPPVAFDHAGRTMFTLGLRNRVQRIDLATGGVIAEWGWRCEPIRSLAVAPDDLTAAAGCQRGEVVLWDLE